MWVRGLKLIAMVAKGSTALSHPMWVRGLKHNSLSLFPPDRVAPHVGAWIETIFIFINYIFITVAPHVGAWIETWKINENVKLAVVAPHVGAWIETVRVSHCKGLSKSHPMWVRGLKQWKIRTRRNTISRTPCGCVD